MNHTLPQALALVENSVEVEELGTAYWVLSAMVLFTCLGGFVGNGLVVWLLGSQGQRSPFSVYILHLGVADLLFLLCMASKGPDSKAQPGT